MIKIDVNGEPRTVADSSSIADLLIEMELADKRVAVERNMEIVPRSQHNSTSLESGDQIEIVHAIGGG